MIIINPTSWQQRGAALITALIFLIILTLLGLTAMQTSSLEERMSGSARNRSLAIQAGEQTLRYAEQDILLSGRVRPVAASAGCVNGICVQADVGAVQVWQDAARLANATVYNTVAMAGYVAPVLPAVDAPPTYLIEYVPRVNVPGEDAGSTLDYYRITSRSVGGDPNTVAFLQEIFRPN